MSAVGITAENIKHPLQRSVGDKLPFTASNGNGADLYVNSKYFGTVFASAEPADVAARLAATQRPLAERCTTDRAPEAVGWKTIPSWYVIGDADKVIPPDIQLKFATRAKSKIYHVPGGDHPSMIAHPWPRSATRRMPFRTSRQRQRRLGNRAIPRGPMAVRQLRCSYRNASRSSLNARTLGA